MKPLPSKKIDRETLLRLVDLRNSISDQYRLADNSSIVAHLNLLKTKPATGSLSEIDREVIRFLIVLILNSAKTKEDLQALIKVLQQLDSIEKCNLSLWMSNMPDP